MISAVSRSFMKSSEIHKILKKNVNQKNSDETFLCQQPSSIFNGKISNTDVDIFTKFWEKWQIFGRKTPKKWIRSTEIGPLFTKFIQWYLLGKKTNKNSNKKKYLKSLSWTGFLMIPLTTLYDRPKLTEQKNHLKVYFFPINMWAEQLLND